MRTGVMSVSFLGQPGVNKSITVTAHRGCSINTSKQIILGSKPPLGKGECIFYIIKEVEPHSENSIAVASHGPEKPLTHLRRRRGEMSSPPLTGWLIDDSPQPPYPPVPVKSCWV